MLKALFQPSPAKIAGRALYADCAAAARRPVFYASAHAADTPEGRFELYLIHVVLVLHRLRGEGAEAKDVSQAVFDAFVRGLDDGLREMGVGDLSVGKKMRKLGEAIYGRLKAYGEAFESADPQEATSALIGRTLYADIAPSPARETRAATMAAYVLQTRVDLADQPLAELLSGRLTFPAFEAVEMAA